MKKYSLLFVVFLFILPAVCCGAETSNQDYYAIVKKLKNNGTTIDFKALRIAYTNTVDYAPYGGDDKNKKAAYDALTKKDYAEAIRQALSILEKNFVDLDAHLFCRIAYRELGDSGKHAFHQSVLKGLVNSLYDSGNGQTPETAIVVISVDEEYFLLRANGLNTIKSSLTDANGHKYDKMEVENKKTSEKMFFYFNVDIPYGWLNNKLNK